MRFDLTGPASAAGEPVSALLISSSHDLPDGPGVGHRLPTLPERLEHRFQDGPPWVSCLTHYQFGERPS